MPTRVISDLLLTSKKVNQLKPSEFEFYIRLLLCVDDFGFFSGDPIEVKNAAYPRRDMLSKEIIPTMDRLTELGLIVRYEAKGEMYLMVTNFINSPRAKRSKYPAPDGHYVTKTEWDSGECTTLACSLHADACNLQADAPLTVTVTVTETENRSVNSAKRKHKYGTYQNVLLTDEELQKLKDRFSDFEAKIQKLSDGIELKGYAYKSHYLAILKWAENDKPKQGQTITERMAGL